MTDECTTQPKYHPAVGRHVAVNGARLWVEEEGQGEPLVLLAGGPAHSHLAFHPYFSALADAYRIIYYDYFGRGQSDHPKSYAEITLARDVADLEGLRQALGLERLNLYGFSYGGLVAHAYALERPGCVRRLVLANTVHSAEMWQKNHENINREAENQYPEVWARVLALRSAGLRSDAPEMQQEFARVQPAVRFYNAANAAKLLSEPGSRNLELYWQFVGRDIDFFIGGEVARLPDFRPRLKELVMPTLVLAGRYDRALYPRYQAEFRQYAPQARFVMMERSGSYAHVEEPDELFRLLREFLR